MLTRVLPEYGVRAGQGNDATAPPGNGTASGNRSRNGEIVCSFEDQSAIHVCAPAGRTPLVLLFAELHGPGVTVRPPAIEHRHCPGPACPIDDDATGEIVPAGLGERQRSGPLFGQTAGAR